MRHTRCALVTGVQTCALPICPLASANADRQFATGSTFKLYILGELAAQIAAGKRRWSDVVPLSHLSFSSAGTANWPKGTPVTLQTLANWMISVSDNGATDTLIHLPGRAAIAARLRSEERRGGKEGVSTGKTLGV